MIEITAKNVKGADLMVTTTVEPTTVNEAVDMLAGIKSGITLTTGKRNRVQTLVITDTRTGRTLVFERDENGTPVKVDEKRPSVKPTNTNKEKAVSKMNSKMPRRLKMQRDVYANGNGSRIEIVITAAKGGGKVYEVRTVRPAVKHVSKGHVIRAGIDTSREVTGHELNVIMRHYEGMGYLFKSHEVVPA